MSGTVVPVTACEVFAEEDVFVFGEESVPEFAVSTLNARHATQMAMMMPESRYTFCAESTTFGLLDLRFLEVRREGVLAVFFAVVFFAVVVRFFGVGMPTY